MTLETQPSHCRRTARVRGAFVTTLLAASVSLVPQAASAQGLSGAVSAGARATSDERAAGALVIGALFVPLIGGVFRRKVEHRRLPGAAVRGKR